MAEMRVLCSIGESQVSLSGGMQSSCLLSGEHCVIASGYLLSEESPKFCSISSHQSGCYCQWPGPSNPDRVWPASINPLFFLFKDFCLSPLLPLWIKLVWFLLKKLIWKSTFLEFSTKNCCRNVLQFYHAIIKIMALTLATIKSIWQRSKDTNFNTQEILYFATTYWKCQMSLRCFLKFLTVNLNI